MKQLAVLFGKIFVVTAIAFGVFVSLSFFVSILLLDIFVFESGLEPIFIHLSWGFFLFTFGFGAFFGIPMALILGLMHYFMLKRVSQNKPFDLSPVQQRTFFLRSDSSSVLENCTLALQKFPARIVERNSRQNYITARTSKSWKTWSDDIRIEVIPIDETNSQIKIVCRPTMKTTLVDYGKNYENAEKLLSMINEAVSTM